VTSYRLDDQGLTKSRSIQTGSVAHPASFRIGTGVSFPGGKVAGA